MSRIQPRFAKSQSLPGLVQRWGDDTEWEVVKRASLRSVGIALQPVGRLGKF